MKNYTLEVTVPYENNDLDSAKEKDLQFGKTVTFNLASGKKYVSKISSIAISGKKCIRKNKYLYAIITCSISDEMFKNFHTEGSPSDWVDYSLNKCVILGKDYMTEYTCS